MLIQASEMLRAAFSHAQLFFADLSETLLQRLPGFPICIDHEAASLASSPDGLTFTLSSWQSAPLASAALRAEAILDLSADCNIAEVGAGFCDGPDTRKSNMDVDTYGTMHI